MLQFRVLGIPVGVDWWFWISGLLLGGGMNAHTSRAWAVVMVWCGVMFLSVLVHELGHALAGRHFGAQPAIKLHGFGGLTVLPGSSFSRGQNILVSGAGPLAGLLLGFVVFAVGKGLGGVDLPHLARSAIRDGLYINFVWTALNLLPIQPLDGGQILRDILGPHRRPITAMVGGILAVGLGVWSFTEGQIYMAVMLGLLAYHNFSQDPMQGGVARGDSRPE
ncbi:MAG: hypothetical protein EXS36_14835 [Pedosphaera sp.]|nr:hypothetical protein [Pedosphaera sp.]